VLEEVETLTKVINSKAKIEQIVESVEIVETLLPQYETTKATYIEAIRKYEGELRKNGRYELIETGRFFQQSESINYLSRLREYIDVSKKYLSYYYKKYNAIKNQEQPQLQSYEALYLKYKRAYANYGQARKFNNQAIERLTDKYPRTATLVIYDKKGSVFTWTK